MISSLVYFNLKMLKLRIVLLVVIIWISVILEASKLKKTGVQSQQYQVLYFQSNLS